MNRSFTKPKTLSLKQHLRAVAWLDKLVDLLVVILGISIAFGINNWADGRKNERKKEQYLVSLSRDLRVDSLALANHQRGLEEMKKVINGLWSLTYKRDLTKADTVARTITKLGAAGFLLQKTIPTVPYSKRAILVCCQPTAYNWRWLSCMIPTRNYS